MAFLYRFLACIAFLISCSYGSDTVFPFLKETEETPEYTQEKYYFSPENSTHISELKGLPYALINPQEHKLTFEYSEPLLNKLSQNWSTIQAKHGLIQALDVYFPTVIWSGKTQLEKLINLQPNTLRLYNGFFKEMTPEDVQNLVENPHFNQIQNIELLVACEIRSLFDNLLFAQKVTKYYSFDSEIGVKKPFQHFNDAPFTDIGLGMTQKPYKDVFIQAIDGKNLRSFGMEYYAGLSYREALPFIAGNSLEKLHLGTLTTKKDDPDGTHLFFEQLAKHTRLKELELTVPIVDAPFVEAFSRYLKNCALQKLSIDTECFISPKSEDERLKFRDFADFLPQTLDTFNFYRALKDEDLAALKQFADKHRQLSYVRFWYHQLSDAGVVEALEALTPLTALTFLDLSRMEGQRAVFTAEQITQMSQSLKVLPNLSYLRMQGNLINEPDHLVEIVGAFQKNSYVDGASNRWKITIDIDTNYLKDPEGGFLPYLEKNIKEKGWFKYGRYDDDQDWVGRLTIRSFTSCLEQPKRNYIGYFSGLFKLKLYASKRSSEPSLMLLGKRSRLNVEGEEWLVSCNTTPQGILMTNDLEYKGMRLVTPFLSRTKGGEGAILPEIKSDHQGASAQKTTKKSWWFW